MSNLKMSESTDPLEYYARPELMTDPQGQAQLFEDLPAEIPALCQVVQGLVLHIFWAERYGVKLSDERKQEVQFRSVARKLARIRELADWPLTVPRPPEKKLVGNCRDFAVMLCAILRHHGIPARARCGFGTYFTPGHYEDHWVCEYWKAGEQRWVMVDSQLDRVQRQALRIQFSPYDLPPGQFVPGGQAWQLCRAARADPDRFGIFEMHGLWFVRGDLMRDLASLNKTELLPWDVWGVIEGEDKDLAPADWALLDCVAGLTLADNDSFHEMRLTYLNNAHLCVPDVIRSYTSARARSEDWAAT